MSEENDAPDKLIPSGPSQSDTSIPLTEPPITDSFLMNLRDIVKDEFDIKYSYLDVRDNLPIFVIEEDEEIKQRSSRLSERLQPHNLLAVIRRVELFEGTGETTTVIKLVPAPPKRAPRSYLWNIILLIATIAAVLWAGWYYAISPPLVYIYTTILLQPYSPVIVMIQYTIAIMAIIGLHELGHYYTSRFHKIEASLPYFIPGLGYGTFGALIVQRTPPPTRDSLFDLGISGPLVGFLVTLIVLVFGLLLSPILDPLQLLELETWMASQGMIAGPFPTPILYEWIWRLMTIGIPANYTAYIHPVALAAWVGFLITGLNYFPIGQLDGGHVSRAIFGSKYHQIASLIGVLILFLLQYWLMALIAFFLFYGRHPGPVDDVSPLSTSRKIIGILSFFLPFLLLPPMVTFF